MRHAFGNCWEFLQFSDFQIRINFALRRRASCCNFRHVHELRLCRIISKLLTLAPIYPRSPIDWCKVYRFGHSNLQHDDTCCTGAPGIVLPAISLMKTGEVYNPDCALLTNHAFLPSGCSALCFVTPWKPQRKLSLKGR